MTGKNKEQFEKWFEERFKRDTGIKLPSRILSSNSVLDTLDLYDFSMQWGVYLEYYDSLGVRIEVLTYPIHNTESGFYFDWIIHLSNENECGTNEEYYSRKEAQEAALKKADEIINTWAETEI